VLNEVKMLKFWVPQFLKRLPAARQICAPVKLNVSAWFRKQGQEGVTCSGAWKGGGGDGENRSVNVCVYRIYIGCVSELLWEGSVRKNSDLMWRRRDPDVACVVFRCRWLRRPWWRRSPAGCPGGGSPRAPCPAARTPVAPPHLPQTRGSPRKGLDSVASLLAN